MTVLYCKTYLLALSSPEEWLVALKRWLVSWFPAPFQLLIGSVLSIGLILGLFAGIFAVITLLERKGLGRIQNRPGPNRVGPFGILQPAADGIKMLTKEDIVPDRADHIVHFLAPIALLAPITLAFAVLPYGKGLTPISLDAGVLFFFAAGAMGELAAFMAGWSSRNKYSLLGAMRAIAQMISYEVPLVLSSVGVVMMVGSMNLDQIVNAQQGYSYLVPHWFIFTPCGLAGFILFMIAAAAESNRSPFDLPEGESEIIGGFMTEYSGFKYAVFFMGEYFGMFAVCGMAITLFLGGWHAPLPFLEWIPSFIWFFGKLICLVFGMIWIRGTLPRLRIDQLMNFSWKFLVPIALWNIIVVGIWRFTAVWQFSGAWIIRWVLCLCCVIIPALWLGRALMQYRSWKPRVYKFAA